MRTAPCSFKTPLILLLMVGSLGLAACGAEPATPPDGGGVAADLASADPVDLADPPPADLASPADLTPAAACEGRPLEMPGDSTRTLRFANKDRTYILHVPTGYDPRRAYPLVLGFHGFTGNSREFLDGTGLPAEADRRGALVVAPQGTGVLPGWNAGACCGEAQFNKVDDIGFVRALLDTLEKGLCVDPKRVYATGFSNGSFFSNRIGCEIADRVAAIATVSGGLVFSPCNPARPIPVLAFHGTKDGTVDYNGNAGLGFPSATKSFTDWAQRDGCMGMSAVTLQSGKTRCEGYTQCRAGVVATLCTLTDGTHSWPDGKLGIVATPTIFDFFGQFRLP